MAEVFAFSIIIFLFSVILHEVAHGLVALYFGDHTAENAGRLTLNPIAHIDPFGSILLPLLLTLSHSGVLLGWARPVPVNPLNFKDIRRGELWVSAAGPLTNLGLAIITALLFHTIPGYSLFKELLLRAVYLNYGLAVFNLIPIPPLDGSKVIMSYLPHHLLTQYERLTPFGFLIIILLSYSGILGVVMGLAFTLLHLILGV